MGYTRQRQRSKPKPPEESSTKVSSAGGKGMLSEAINLKMFCVNIIILYFTLLCFAYISLFYLKIRRRGKTTLCFFFFCQEYVSMKSIRAELLFWAPKKNRVVELKQRKFCRKTAQSNPTKNIYK